MTLNLTRKQARTLIDALDEAEAKYLSLTFPEGSLMAQHARDEANKCFELRQILEDKQSV